MHACTKLDPGTYEITVDDLSEEHNFHLSGPGVDRATEIGDVGTQTWTVTLRDGTYTYVCDPHQGTMRGSFTVGNVTTPPPTPKPADERGDAEVEAPADVRPRLHDLAEDRGRQGGEDDDDRHVHGRRARPLARSTTRTSSAPATTGRTTVAYRRDADVEGEARAVGTLRFLCDPHAAQMKGSAKIVRR